jgi:hypothetical protein
MASALKTRPTDLAAFREYALGRKNCLLSIDTSFVNRPQAEETIKAEFPDVEIHVFIDKMAVVFLKDPNCLDAFLQADWLLAGHFSIPAGPSVW